MFKIKKIINKGIRNLGLFLIGSLFALVGTVLVQTTFVQPTFADASLWGWSNQSKDYNPNVIGSDEGIDENKDKLITVIKNAINWVLGILGLIALIILLWGGFGMVTAAGDEEKFNRGFKILKQAGIGLAFIAFSWLFVSLVFWLIDKVST